MSNSADAAAGVTNGVLRGQMALFSVLPLLKSERLLLAAFFLRMLRSRSKNVPRK
jgi:hypothetical protein